MVESYIQYLNFNIMLIWLVFLAFFSNSLQAKISYAIIPDQIIQQIEIRSIDEVHAELFSDQIAANMVLLAIDSGAEDWLVLAKKLFFVKNIRTQEMITMSVGEALQWSPGSVLAMVSAEFPLNKVCSLDGLYEWRRFSLFLAQTAIIRRIEVLDKFQNSRLESVKSECLQILQGTLRQLKLNMDNLVDVYP